MGKQRSLGLGIVVLMVAFLVVGLTGTAFAAQPAKVGDPKTGPARAEVVNIAVTDATGGTFTLSFDADGDGSLETTGDIAWNAAGTAVAAALNAIPGTTWTASGTGTLVNAVGGTNITFSPVGNVPPISRSRAGLIPTSGDRNVTITTTESGQVAGLDVSPHGGYSSSTDYCLQCHSPHGSSTSSYAILRNLSVTETCNTCHSIYTQGGINAYDPGLAGLGIGTTSVRAVFENGQPQTSSFQEDECEALTGASKPVNCAYPILPAETGFNGTGATFPNVYGHNIGKSGGRLYGANWSTSRYTADYDFDTFNNIAGPTDVTGLGNSTVTAGPGTASRVTGGIYCGSCHTPHGADRGLAVNTEKTDADWANGATIWWENNLSATTTYAGILPGQSGNVKLFSDAASDYGWVVCDSGAGDKDSATCRDATTASTQDEEVSLYAYQLLTMANHQYAGRSVTNDNVCSNGLPGTVTPTTDADCTALYGAGVTAGITSALPSTSYRIEDNGQDAGAWCGQCHPNNVDIDAGGAYHAHPTACTTCHGNTPASISAPGAGNGFPDFPHSSIEEALLQELPDALCITCHINLP